MQVMQREIERLEEERIQVTITPRFYVQLLHLEIPKA